MRDVRRRDGGDDDERESVTSNDVEAGQIDFGQILVSKFLLPTMRTTLANKLTVAERYPMTGPNEPVDEDIVHVSAADPAIDTSEAFPTEQMVKYKKALKESGRKPTRQTTKPVEQHFDDCGEDTTSLVGVSSSLETYRDTYYDDDMGNNGEPMRFEAHSHVRFYLDRDYDLSDIMTYAFQSGGSKLVAADFIDLYESMQVIHSYVVHKFGPASHVDILEVMGGEARTTQVMVRRNDRGGYNFYCVVGFDLMRADDEQCLYDYIRATKPFIVVMAPQCTGLAGWGNFNQMMNPEAHKRSVDISLHLGRICAHCAILQLEAQPRRHFFAEQPADSAIYVQPEWVHIAHIPGVTWGYMNMCMAGLVSREHIPLMKPSELWASHEILLVCFRKMVCDHKHQHEQIEGGGITSFANLDMVLCSDAR